MVEPRRLDPNHREIGVRILADELSGMPTAIRQGHINLIRTVHDVAVREGKAVWRKDKAGPAASGPLLNTLASGRSP